MVVLKIQVDDLVAFNPESQPPVARDMQAPSALAVTGQSVRFPQRKGAQLILRSLSAVSALKPFEELAS